MEIKTITVREVRNLSNYQTRTAEAIDYLNEGDNPSFEMQKLIKFVRDELYQDSETSQDTENPQRRESSENDASITSDTPSPVPVVKVKPPGNSDEDGIPF